MEQVVSATEARVHFGELMRRVVESDTPVIVERDGKPQMVVISMRTYTRLQNGTQTGDWLALVDQARAQIRADLGGRPIEPPPEEIIRQMREERIDTEEMLMVKHDVFLRFKPETTQAQRQALADALSALPALISEIKGFKVVWTVAGRPARNAQIALFSEFESTAALDRYIAHPEHQKIVPLIDALCENRISFDYE